jgi:hypothetical protein
VEINANPWGLDLDWRWHQRAIELGCIMSINPDAHSTREIDLTHRGCGDGAEGRGPANRVLNCLTIAQLMEHLRKRKKCSPVRPDFSDLKKDNPHAHARRREEIAEKVTGWARPSRDNLSALVRDRKASTLRFKDDGIIPNHPKWPLVIYRGAVRFPKKLDPAAVFEELFESNSWGDSWRNGIYDYVHYHSRIHEVLGIPR